MIDPDLAAGLKRLKQIDPEHESEGQIVRRALREYLTKKGVLQPQRKRPARRKRADPST